MRTTWKRAAVGLLIAGAVGGAALGLARPGDPPTFIPHTDDPGTPDLPAVPPVEGSPVVQAQVTEPVLRNDPAVALDWSGPAVVKANQPTEYTLSVRNVCGQSLQKVVLQVRAPKGTDITTTNPAVKPIDGVYLWEFGTLDAKTTKSVTVTLKQPAKGDMTCQAWVTLTGTSAMKAVVKEPKLAVTIKAPDKVVVGDKVAVQCEVINTGDLAATDVKLFVPGLTPQPLALGEIAPGQTKLYREEFAADVGGVRTVETTATGADGLKASAKTTVKVLVPKLDVSVSGPKERLIGTKGKYTVTVANSGEVPVNAVRVREAIPAGFKVCATGPGRLADDRLTWDAGDLAPGASKSFEFEGVTHTAGQLTLKAEASGDRNTKATGECVTAVEGIPGLRMELVDSTDPVEKNGEITYEIKVTNTGTKADSNVAILCELPKELEFVSCSGPTKGEYSEQIASTPKSKAVRMVGFQAVSDLAPKTEAVFKVKVKGTGTGDVRFKAVMTSKHLTAPVTKEESTRVYGE